MRLHLKLTPLAWVLIARAAAMGCAPEQLQSAEAVPASLLVRLDAEQLVLLDQRGELQVKSRDAIDRHPYEAGTLGRWAALTLKEGTQSPFVILGWEQEQLIGQDGNGKRVQYALKNLERLVIYPVRRIVKELPVAYVRQKPDYCGEACVEMASAFLGRRVPQEKVNEAARPAETRGAYSHELERALDVLGLKTAPVRARTCKSELQLFAETMRLLWALERKRVVLLGIWADYDHKTNAQTWAFDHFVLLTGYDLRSSSFMIQNPGGHPDWKVSFDELIKHRANRGGTAYAIEFPFLRTWQLKDGKKTTGEFVAYEEESKRILLKAGDGSVLEVPAENLEEAEREFMERLK